MKIFFLTPRVPYPIDKGDKLRAFYQLKYLSKSHDIHLFAIDENCSLPESYSVLNKYCKSVNVVNLNRWRIFLNLFFGLFRKIPFQTSYYYSKSIKSKIENSISEIQPDLIFCQLIRSAEFLIDIKQIPKAIDYVDVISKGLERRISASNLFWKMILKQEYKRAVEYEEHAFNVFNKSIIITDEDRNNLLFTGKENVEVLPNGIDMDFFKPLDSEKKYDLFFSGNLNYPPNVNAAEYIAYELLPLLQTVCPDIRILIAGASPNKKVLSLQSKNISVKGWVDDIRDYYKQSKIFLAPMQIGTGLQNKLLQAMAMNMPCVVSELTQRGLSPSDKEIVLVAKDPKEYVKLISKLLSDSNYANSIAKNGYNYVKEKYNWENIILNLDGMLKSLIKS
mgnify:CR=1 FL=1